MTSVREKFSEEEVRGKDRADLQEIRGAIGGGEHAEIGEEPEEEKDTMTFHRDSVDDLRLAIDNLRFRMRNRKLSIANSSFILSTYRKFRTIPRHPLPLVRSFRNCRSAREHIRLDPGELHGDLRIGLCALLERAALENVVGE